MTEFGIPCNIPSEMRVLWYFEHKLQYCGQNKRQKMECCNTADVDPFSSYSVKTVRDGSDRVHSIFYHIDFVGQLGRWKLQVCSAVERNLFASVIFVWCMTKCHWPVWPVCVIARTSLPARWLIDRTSDNGRHRGVSSSSSQFAAAAAVTTNVGDDRTVGLSISTVRPVTAAGKMYIDLPVVVVICNSSNVYRLRVNFIELLLLILCRRCALLARLQHVSLCPPLLSNTTVWQRGWGVENTHLS